MSAWSQRPCRHVYVHMRYFSYMCMCTNIHEHVFKHKILTYMYIYAGVGKDAILEGFTNTYYVLACSTISSQLTIRLKSLQKVQIWMRLLLTCIIRGQCKRDQSANLMCPLIANYSLATEVRYYLQIPTLVGTVLYMYTVCILNLHVNWCRKVSKLWRICTDFKTVFTRYALFLQSSCYMVVKVYSLHLCSSIAYELRGGDMYMDMYLNIYV